MKRRVSLGSASQAVPGMPRHREDRDDGRRSRCQRRQAPLQKDFSTTKVQPDGSEVLHPPGHRPRADRTETYRGSVAPAARHRQIEFGRRFRAVAKHAGRAQAAEPISSVPTTSPADQGGTMDFDGGPGHAGDMMGVVGPSRKCAHSTPRGLLPSAFREPSLTEHHRRRPRVQGGQDRVLATTRGAMSPCRSASSPSPRNNWSTTSTPSRMHLRSLVTHNRQGDLYPLDRGLGNHEPWSIRVSG